jgi:hypothetical protein
VLVGQLQRGSQLRPLIESVVACAGLDFLKGLNQAIALGLGKRFERGLLCFQTNAGAALLVDLG